MCHSHCLWSGEGQDQCLVLLRNAGGSGKMLFLMVLSAQDWSLSGCLCFLPSGGIESSWHKRTVRKQGLIFKRIQRQIRSKKLGLETDRWFEEPVL